MLGKELETTLNEAFRSAREQRHEYMTVEHLLLAMLSNRSAFAVLRACGADAGQLERDLRKHLAETVPALAPDAQRETQPTIGFQRVLQRSLFHVQSTGKKQVTGANVLVALFGERESHAVYLLDRQNVTRLDVVNYLSHGVSKVSDPDEDAGDARPMGEEGKPGEGAGGSPSPLESFAVDLNRQAEEGRIDPLVGRRAEVERTMQILCRRRKNNPLLVGDAGVGKTAIAEGLAAMIVEGGVPEAMAGSTIYTLDLGALLAGTKYRGDFEKRLKKLLAQLRKKPKSILFIDEIHTIIGAGAASGGVMDASNLIKPMLATGELRCIGSTTYNEYRGVFEKDRALSRRFQMIEVNEPSAEETVRILQGLKPRFEEHHEVRFTRQALEAAVNLADRYINDRMLPDKAIDVIDEAGASQRLLPASRRKRTIGVAEVEGVVARIARIPPKTVSTSDREAIRSLDRDLKLLVFGQDDAIDTLVAAVKMARSGLGSPDKPVGCFLLSGPTGVGKTEVTRQLARLLGVELIRFDMSEYMERHTVSRLIGAPPGYVGFDQGGLLTEAVNKHPHSVLLLDEIEKAHPDVFNLLLQVMDHGALTDNNGRRADFRNVTVVMTTNAGAEQRHRRSMGFSQQDHSSDSMEAIVKTFSPEFRNRLDAVVEFGRLDPRTIARVVDKFIVELEAQLEEQQVTLQLTDDAREWLAEHGFDPAMGARPMARVIQERIKRPLADELLFGRLADGGHVVVGTGEQGIELACEPAPPKNSRGRPGKDPGKEPDHTEKSSVTTKKGKTT